jgi:TatD DNase family protein
MLVDSHAHLELFEDLEDVLIGAKTVSVSKIITIGTSLETSKKAIQIAENFSNSELEIFATCGIHPNDGAEEVENLGLREVMKKLEEIAKSSKKVVGIGECGLDYFETGDKRPIRNSQGKQETSAKEREFQGKLFKRQIKLASNLNLPLVVHSRNAWDEIFEFFPNNKLRGIFHSWTGDLEAMGKALALGFYISFSGIVTFGNAKDIQEVAKKAPIDRILVETDSPFLSPEPMRGMKNEPKNVKITADFISSLRSSSLLEIADMTTRSACEVFGV